MSALVRQARAQVTILIGFLAGLWTIELIDLLVLRRSLDRFGIRPRTDEGLLGILLAPLLHGGLPHLIANSVPLFFLGWLVLLRGVGTFLAVTAISVLLGGLGIWLFGGSNTIHIGASGLIFGYLGYLLLRGYFERSFGSILIALMVGVLYGGALWGVLPSRPGISWEGHLFGFLAGIVAARVLATRRSRWVRR